MSRAVERRYANEALHRKSLTKKNTATRVEGGTGVAVWKDLAVDDSVKQLSTTATTLIRMVRAGNKFAQFQ